MGERGAAATVLLFASFFLRGRWGLCGEVDARDAGMLRVRDVCVVDFDERLTRNVKIGEGGSWII